MGFCHHQTESGLASILRIIRLVLDEEEESDLEIVSYYGQRNRNDVGFHSSSQILLAIESINDANLVTMRSASPETGTRSVNLQRKCCILVLAPVVLQ